jgi:cysteine desulfurase/selenocysteine lyase
VVDAVSDAMSSMGNPGRGVHAMAEAATAAIIDARATVAAALHAWRQRSSPHEVVFTSGTTAAVNLVAEAWALQHVGEGDVVIASEAEHHSNLVPWQRVCERTRATLVLARVDDRGCFDLDAFRDHVADHGERVKLVAIAHVSNVLGTIAPIEDIARIAQSVGARVLVDGAQAIAHLEVDVAALGCDFYAFSGHKVYGVPGAGVLWAKRELLAAMPPWQLGGGMVGVVAADRSTWRDEPARFEAGTPNTPAIVGLAHALDWAREHATRDDEVHAALVETIRAAGARVIGEPTIGVVSFAWDYHPHDIATIADGEGVAVRSGHHCAQLVHERFGVHASTRASVGGYSGLDDVEQLARALAKVRHVLGPR